MAPIFKALSITEHKQKTPLTFLDFEEPELKDNELLVENSVAAQVGSFFRVFPRYIERRPEPG